MYTESISRRFTVATLLVATLSGLVAASNLPANLPAGQASRSAIVQGSATLPELPEVVVTAPRLRA